MIQKSDPNSVVFIDKTGCDGQKSSDFRFCGVEGPFVIVSQVILDFDEFWILGLKRVEIWSERINADSFIIERGNDISGQVVSWHSDSFFVFDFEIKFVHGNLKPVESLFVQKS